MTLRAPTALYGHFAMGAPARRVCGPTSPGPVSRVLAGAFAHAGCALCAELLKRGFGGGATDAALLMVTVAPGAPGDAPWPPKPTVSGSPERAANAGGRLARRSPRRNPLDACRLGTASGPVPWRRGSNRTEVHRTVLMSASYRSRLARWLRRRVVLWSPPIPRARARGPIAPARRPPEPLTAQTNARPRSNSQPPSRWSR